MGVAGRGGGYLDLSFQYNHLGHTHAGFVFLNTLPSGAVEVMYIDYFSKQGTVREAVHAAFLHEPGA